MCICEKALGVLHSERVMCAHMHVYPCGVCIYFACVSIAASMSVTVASCARIQVCNCIYESVTVPVYLHPHPTY